MDFSKAALARNINRYLRRFGYEIRGQHTLHPPFVPGEFWRIQARVAGLSLVPWEALHDTFRAVRYVAEANIPGDMVECGVWRGGCSILMAETLAAAGCTDRDIYMYDTYQGMPDAGTEDVSIASGETAAHKRDRKQGQWIAASVDDVRSNVERSNYPAERFHLIEGMVEDTIPNDAPSTIALLRLDTDLYASTKHELEHLFPRLAEGGVMIVDDYGGWAGSTQAVNEYMDEHGHHFMSIQNPVHGSITLIKRSSG